MLFNDLLKFLSALFGRSIVQTSSATVISPTGVTQNVAVPIAKVPKPTITAQQAITQAIATETKLNPRDFVSGWYVATNPAWQEETVNGEIVFGWNPGATCGGLSTPQISFQQAAGFATEAAAIGLSSAAQAGAIAASTAALASTVVLAPIGLIVAIIGAIFAHHAQAVARDNRAECALIPASNNAFKAIIDAVKSGQITPAQGAAGMDAISQQFLTQAGAAKNNSPYCNALCEYLIRVRAISFYWKSQFLSME